jgi:hypothetical protein
MSEAVANPSIPSLLALSEFLAFQKKLLESLFLNERALEED